MLTNSFTLITRISYKDTHYAGNLVAGATLLELFGDAVTGLSAYTDHDESLLQEWSNIRFLEKVMPGDFIKVVACLDEEKRLRREVSVKAYRIIKACSSGTSDLYPEQEEKVICSAVGTIVIPLSKFKKREKSESV